MSYGRGRRPRSSVSDAAPKDDIQIPDKIPYMVVIIGELAGLMQTVAADVESAIAGIT
jgi:DNA segregation ATPase FtsK/SpoIIIE-like protein